ncbi:AMP-binding protein, partial [Halomonas campaniensis]
MRTSPEAFLARLARHTEERPTRIALEDVQHRLTFAELSGEIESRRRRLHDGGAKRVALALDNGIDWALWDLALLQEGRVSVPVPAFFSDAQRCHLVDAAGLDAWIGPGGEAHG